MKQMTGRPLVEQNVLGRLHFLQRPALELAVTSHLNWEEEETRFFRAQHRAVAQLGALYDRVLRRGGEEIAAIFAIHAMLLEDEEFVNTAQAMIRDKGVTAEYAVQVVWGGFAAAFERMDSPYMQARALDIRDISNRMIRLLLHLSWKDPLRGGPAILVADEFLPSEIMDLDNHRLLGLVARYGNTDSHTAILLRACRIPAMAQVELGSEWEGHLALLDGAEHQLYLDPDEELVAEYRCHTRANHWTPARKGEMELQTV